MAKSKGNESSAVETQTIEATDVGAVPTALTAPAAPASEPLPGGLIVANAFERGVMNPSKLTNEVRALLNASTFIALRPDGEVAEANRANMDGEEMMLSCLARAKVPSGGGTAFRLFDVNGESNVQEIEGVIVLCQPRGALWPSDDPRPGSLPYLVTNDMHIAYRLGDDHGTLNLDQIEACRLEPAPGDTRPRYDWQKLPYTQFGSSTKGSGKGKRAKEARMLAILRKDDAFPILLNAPPTSVKGVRAFMLQLSPLVHYRAVAKLTLSNQRNDTGQEYGRIEIRKTAALSREEGEFINRQYTTPLRALVNSGRLNVESDDFRGDEG